MALLDEPSGQIRRYPHAVVPEEQGEHGSCRTWSLRRHRGSGGWYEFRSGRRGSYATLQEHAEALQAILGDHSLGEGADVALRGADFDREVAVVQGQDGGLVAVLVLPQPSSRMKRFRRIALPYFRAAAASVVLR